MTSKVRKAYKQALADDEFNKLFLSTGEKKPNMFTQDITKHLYMTIYSGYLLAKFGAESYIKLGD